MGCSASSTSSRAMETPPAEAPGPEDPGFKIGVQLRRISRDASTLLDRGIESPDNVSFRNSAFDDPAFLHAVDSPVSPRATGEKTEVESSSAKAKRRSAAVLGIKTPPSERGGQPNSSPRRVSASSIRVNGPDTMNVGIDGQISAPSEGSNSISSKDCDDVFDMEGAEELLLCDAGEGVLTTVAGHARVTNV